MTGCKMFFVGFWYWSTRNGDQNFTLFRAPIPMGKCTFPPPFIPTWPNWYPTKQILVSSWGECVSGQEEALSTSQLFITTAEGAESLLDDYLQPGHVTDSSGELFPSLSHGGVEESRRWSKHHQLRILIFFFSFFFLSFTLDVPLVIFDKSPTSCGLLSFQRWATTAALIYRLCLKRSGTSWRSWIWSSPRVRCPHRPCHSYRCGGMWSVYPERVYRESDSALLSQTAETRSCCSGSGHEHEKL